MEVGELSKAGQMSPKSKSRVIPGMEEQEGRERRESNGIFTGQVKKCELGELAEQGMMNGNRMTVTYFHWVLADQRHFAVTSKVQ